MKIILDKSTFMKGLQVSPEFGFNRMDGVRLESWLGFIGPGIGGSQVDASNIDRNINTLVLDNSDAAEASRSYMWCVADQEVYKLDLLTIEATTLATTADYDYGACAYGDYLYIATTADIGRGALAGTDTAGFAWNPNFMSTDVGTGGHALNEDIKHPMIVYADKMYIADGEYIGEYRKDTDTFNYQALTLEDGWKAVSLAPYGEYLAIGAVKDSGSGAVPGHKSSKLFFWDTTLSTWDKDRSTLVEGGRLNWIANKRGILYVMIEEDAGNFSMSYFNGTAIKSIKRLNTDYYGDETSISYEQAKDVLKDNIYFGIDSYPTANGGTGETKIMVYGSIISGEDSIFYSPWRPKGGGADSAFITAVKWGADYQLFVAWMLDGSPDTYGLNKISGYGTYTLETPIISNEGKKQTLKSIRINFQPLASGDTLAIRRNVDYAGFEDSDWKTVSYAANGAIKTVEWGGRFEFRDLQLKLYTAGGNPKIKSIIIKTDDIPEP